jgi:hypothetical protein
MGAGTLRQKTLTPMAWSFCHRESQAIIEARNIPDCLSADLNPNGKSPPFGKTAAFTTVLPFWAYR